VLEMRESGRISHGWIADRWYHRSLQRNPLDPIFDELCDSMKLDRAKLVLSYNGRKIYGGSLTPMQLGIGGDVVIGGSSSICIATVPTANAESLVLP
jgi:hypothetical protein